MGVLFEHGAVRLAEHEGAVQPERQGSVAEQLVVEARRL
jgi:hypothetical protein